MTLQLYLVETTPGIVARCQYGAERSGLPFRVRTVLPGPSGAPGDVDEDDGRVAPLLLRLDRTAEALDCSPTTVKRLIRAGDLPAVKVHGATRVRVVDLQAYVERLGSQARAGGPSSRHAPATAAGSSGPAVVAAPTTTTTKGPRS